MTHLTANPFKFGDPVQGDYYLPRPALNSLVKQFLENHIHIVLMGPRRFGKTSFVLNLLNNLEDEDYTCLMVDIFNITSHKDFLQQMLRAIKTKDFKNKIKLFLREIGHYKPKLSLDLDSKGHPSFGLAFDEWKEEDVKNGIQDLFDSLSRLGKKVIVCLDEFQKISEIDDKGWLEATLRSHSQKLKNVTFLFTGSRKSLISEMLNDPSRPLYRSCQTIEFPVFGNEFEDWCIKRFLTVGITCEKKAISYLQELVQGTPNYVQMACFQLVTQAKKHIQTSDIEEILATMAKQNAYAYQTLLNSLTLAQQRVLRLCAIETRAIFQNDFLNKYEITSSAALHSSIKALKDKGILDEEGTRGGKVIFDDPLFSHWLRLHSPTVSL